MQFHVEPVVGILEAGAETDMTLSFAPESQHRCIHIFVWHQADSPCFCEAPVASAKALCQIELASFARWVLQLEVQGL